MERKHFILLSLFAAGGGFAGKYCGEIYKQVSADVKKMLDDKTPKIKFDRNSVPDKLPQK